MRPILIEQTGRRYKAGFAAGACTAIGGFIRLGQGSVNLYGTPCGAAVANVGAVVMVVGVVVVLVSAVLGWWHHG